jgi:hypothetical protein
MFDAFDEGARRALFFARWNVTQPGVEFDFHGIGAVPPDAHAMTQGGAELDDVHVLLGVLQADAQAVTRFADPAWSRDRLRERLSVLAPRDSLVSMAQEIPFSAAAKETVLAAAARPRSEGRPVVPEHLVWAILAKPSTPVAAVLAEAGVTRDAIAAFLDRP